MMINDKGIRYSNLCHDSSFRKFNKIIDMEPKEDVFSGTRDRYKGVTVSTASEGFEITKFPTKLQSK